MNFRLQLIKHGLTMQEAFEEFARLVGIGNTTANNILERLIRAQVRQELAEVGLDAPKHHKKRINELDTETLYHLINESDIKSDAR